MNVKLTLTRVTVQVLSWLISLCDLLSFKSNRFCFYITHNTFMDANQQALYQYIKTHTQEKHILIDGNNFLNKNIFKVIRTIYYLVTSKYIIFDHAIPFGLISKRHVRVNLWHGTPLKKIRAYLSDDYSKYYSHKQALLTDLLTSNSSYDAMLMSSAMSVPRYNVLDFGLPRNDYLLCDEQQINNIDMFDEYKQLQVLKQGFNKVILWAPTFRGMPKELIDPLDLTEPQQELICSLLEKHNATLWLRAHKFSKVTKLEKLLAHPSVFDVSNIANSNLILRLTDLLITDFSSIWIDFLLLNKPIIIYAQDYGAYIKQQGFILDFKKQLPVPMLENFTDLIDSIEVEIRVVSFAGYIDVKNKFHHPDKRVNKSELVYKEIKNFKRLSLFRVQK